MKGARIDQEHADGRDRFFGCRWDCGHECHQEECGNDAMSNWKWVILCPLQMGFQIPPLLRVPNHRAWRNVLADSFAVNGFFMRADQADRLLQKICP